MAKAEKKVIVTEQSEIVLILTEKEAKLVKSLFGGFCGDSAEVSAIYEAINPLVVCPQHNVISDANHRIINAPYIWKNWETR